MRRGAEPAANALQAVWVCLMHSNVETPTQPLSAPHLRRVGVKGCEERVERSVRWHKVGDAALAVGHNIFAPRHILRYQNGLQQCRSP